MIGQALNVTLVKRDHRIGAAIARALLAFINCHDTLRLLIPVLYNANGTLADKGLNRPCRRGPARNRPILAGKIELYDSPWRLGAA